MRNELRTEIKRLSKRAFDKARKQAEKKRKYRDKFEKRTGLFPMQPKLRHPTYLNKHFDPKYCKRNANVIATAIWRKILEKKYHPEPAVTYEHPKPDGGKRIITAFGIPDAAVANVLLRRTLNRNKKRLSPHSYAYHPDKNTFDAILALRDFDKDGKFFVVQIDFEKYFDNIPTNYLKKKMKDRSILSLTPHERHVFESFLHHEYGNSEAHRANNLKRKVKGTPQGSSVSLLLANLANHDLDRKLSAESGKFVRFSDDVVAICGSYEEAQRLERCFERHCSESGLIVNRKKSPGIAILSDHDHEIRTISNFTYLGYDFRDTGLAMPDKTKQRLQQKVSRLINVYLINVLKHGYAKNRADRKRRYDWDLLGLVYELRRSFYGGLSEKHIQDFLDNKCKLKSMRGLMGFYCLIEDAQTLRELDGWIVNMVRRACVVRHKKLKNQYNQDCPTPSNEELILGTWFSKTAWRKKGSKKDALEVKFPSLIRGWRAARKHFFTFGLEGVQPPVYDSSRDSASLFDLYA